MYTNGYQHSRRDPGEVRAPCTGSTIHLLHTLAHTHTHTPQGSPQHSHPLQKHTQHGQRSPARPRVHTDTMGHPDTTTPGGAQGPHPQGRAGPSPHPSRVHTHGSQHPPRSWPHTRSPHPPPQVTFTQVTLLPSPSQGRPPHTHRPRPSCNDPRRGKNRKHTLPPRRRRRPHSLKVAAVWAHTRSTKPRPLRPETRPARPAPGPPPGPGPALGEGPPAGGASPGEARVVQAQAPRRPAQGAGTGGTHPRGAPASSSSSSGGRSSPRAPGPAAAPAPAPARWAAPARCGGPGFMAAAAAGAAVPGRRRRGPAAGQRALGRGSGSGGPAPPGSSAPGRARRKRALPPGRPSAGAGRGGGEAGAERPPAAGVPAPALHRPPRDPGAEEIARARTSRRPHLNLALGTGTRSARRPGRRGAWRKKDPVEVRGTTWLVRVRADGSHLLGRGTLPLRVH